MIVDEQALAQLSLFARLGDDDLREIALYGTNPDAEPTAKRLAEVIDRCRKDRIAVIYSESFLSDKLAKIIAGQTRAKVLALNPGANLTTEQIENHTSFISLMEENLENLTYGLVCEQP